MTETEKQDIKDIASGLSNNSVIDGLNSILERNALILDSDDIDDDIREMVTIDMSVIAASIDRIQRLSQDQTSQPKL